MTTAAFFPCAEPQPSTYWDSTQAAYQLENDPTKVIYMDANEGAKCRKSPRVGAAGARSRHFLAATINQR
jgi:hypothetical protein